MLIIFSKQDRHTFKNDAYLTFLFPYLHLISSGGNDAMNVYMVYSKEDKVVVKSVCELKWYNHQTQLTIEFVDERAYVYIQDARPRHAATWSSISLGKCIAQNVTHKIFNVKLLIIGESGYNSRESEMTSLWKPAILKRIFQSHQSHHHTTGSFQSHQRSPSLLFKSK